MRQRSEARTRPTSTDRSETMKFKKLIRAGLLVLALGLLLGICFSVPTFDASYAQAPAAAPAAPAAAPADAGPPACSAKVLTECTPNSGDTAWMLTSVALVLMMTIPGLGLFYGGMVRKKNVGDTVMTSFAVTCLVTILFAILTYSMAFRSGTPFIGGLDRMCPNDPGERLYLLPDDVRDHHTGADRRRLRRAHEILGHALVHRAVGDLRLCADRALGLGTGWHLLLRQRRRLGQGARFRRRDRRAYQRGRRRTDVRHHARQARR